MGIIADLITIYVDDVNKTAIRTHLRDLKDLAAFTKRYTAGAPPLLGEPAYGEDGSLYIGSNFGQVRKRDASGAWSAIDTGSLSPITAVVASAGRLLVGTHGGDLLASGDNVQPWRTLHHFGKSEVVLSVHLSGQTYLIVTGLLTDPAAFRPTFEGLKIYTLDRSGQTPQLNHKIDFPSKLPYFRMMSLYGTLAGKYYLVNAVESVERLDLATLIWKKLSPPHDISHLRVANGGALITAFKGQGGFSKLSYSTDFGDTWTQIDTPSYPVNDIRMDSPSSGFASRWENGAFAQSLQLTQYDPASHSWKQLWAAPQSTCTRTIRDNDGKEQLCVASDGSILRIGSGKPVPEFLAD